MSTKYRIRDHQDIHFITFSVVQWVDALSRPMYKDIVIDALKYCQKNKGLVLSAYVIMNNHIHLIAAASEGNSLSSILRDLKRHTSKELLNCIKLNKKESRKSWMLWIFKSAGQCNTNNKDFQFWQQDNHSIQLSTAEMLRQRLNYIHQNPVVAGLVWKAEYYVYSSAIDYAGGRGLLEIELL